MMILVLNFFLIKHPSLRIKVNPKGLSPICLSLVTVHTGQKVLVELENIVVIVCDAQGILGKQLSPSPNDFTNCYYYHDHI
jgi:hypothetical protein